MKIRTIQMKRGCNVCETLIFKKYKAVKHGSMFLYFKNKKVFEYRSDFVDYRGKHVIRLWELDFGWIVSLADDYPERYPELVEYLETGKSYSYDEVHAYYHKIGLNDLAKLMVENAYGFDNVVVQEYDYVGGDTLGYTITGTEKEQQFAFKLLTDVHNVHPDIVEILRNKKGDYSKLVLHILNYDDLARAVVGLPETLKSEL